MYIQGYAHISKSIVVKFFKKGTSGAAAYQLGNTCSRTITEVKQRWARLLLGWETPVQVLPECCC